MEESASTNNKSWYVVQAVAQYEGSVKRTMLEHIKRKGLEDYFGDILVPTEEVIEIRDGQKRKVERKFFPGYILVNMEMTEDAWHLVRHIPRVLGFVGGTADKPAPISKREVDKILGRIEGIADKPKPQHSFVPGEAVRIKEGPFADFEGVVEQADYDKNRLSVAVMIFGRSTPVDLEFGQVEKIK